MKIGRKRVLFLLSASVLVAAGFWIWADNFSNATGAKSVAADAVPVQPQNAFPSDIIAALPSAASWTLLSLNPGKPKGSSESFHGWEVLGRLPFFDSKASLDAVREIVEAAGNWDNSHVLCFWPRHGLSVMLKDGRRVDFVICYECVQAKMLVNGEFGDAVHFGTKGTKVSPAPLNDLLKANNIPMPPQPD